MIYVANTADNSLSIINGNTNAVVTVPVPGTFPFPVGVAVNIATGSVYVANNVDQTVSVFTASGTLVTTIHDGSFSSPQGIAANPVTNRIYVANGCSCTGNTITVIDGSINAVIHVTTVGNDPLAVAVNPVTNMIYAPNSSDGTVSVINGANNVVTATIPVTPDPEGIAVNPVTNTIYVTDFSTGQLTAIDGNTNTPGPPLDVSIFCLQGIAVDAATNIIYVADPSGSQLYAVNGTTSAITQISDPTNLDGPFGVDLNPSTGLVYVTNAGNCCPNDYVTVYRGIGGSPATAPTENCSPFVLPPGASTTCTITLNSLVPIGGVVTKSITSPAGASITGCSNPTGGLNCGTQPNPTTLNLGCGSYSGICAAGSTFQVTVSGASTAPLAQTIAQTPPGGGAQASFNLTGLTTPAVQATVALNSSANPSTSGQPVTFTATVTCTGFTPTGTVAFKDGGFLLATMAVTAGTAGFTTSTLAPGSHSMTATYSGDGNCIGASSPVLTQVVNGSPATVGLTSSPNPSNNGQPVSFTATITCTGFTPTGTVTFLDSGSALATVAVSGGTAIFTTAVLAPGSHSITANYSGDQSCTPASSPVLTQVVSGRSGGLVPTTTSLSSSQNPSSPGQPVTFTAAVGCSGFVATGTVLFADGGRPLASVALDGTGQAAFTTSSLGAGNHAITAAYSSDAHCAASGSPPLTQVVGGRVIAPPGTAAPQPAPTR